VTTFQKKYVMAIFVDISGAFDNLWWPALLGSLAGRNIPHHLLAIIKREEYPT
jgi:hypothetical protein